MGRKILLIEAVRNAKGEYDHTIKQTYPADSYGSIMSRATARMITENLQRTSNTDERYEYAEVVEEPDENQG